MRKFLFWDGHFAIGVKLRKIETCQVAKAQ